MSESNSILIIGAGNFYRSDDGAGLAVARRLREAVLPDVEVVEGIGDGTDLLRLWCGYDRVYIVDAIHAGVPAGEVRRYDLPEQTLPTELASNQSTHSFNIAEAIELADALASMPDILTIFGIQGKDFSTGTKLSGEVERAVELVVDTILREIGDVKSDRGGSD